MARKATDTTRSVNTGRPLYAKQKGALYDDRSPKEKRADWLLDRQIDLPLYALLGILVAHALSGTTSFSLPQLSTHLPHSLQTLLPTWARHLPILAPFSTELPNASHDSKFVAGDSYWAPTGYAGPFRSDAVGFGHPLTALHNLTRACLGLSYEVVERTSAFGAAAASLLPDDLRYGQSYFDRYPWNSWLSQTEQGPSFLARKFEKGAKDILFVVTGILLFTVIRALAIRYLLVPLAHLFIRDPTTSATFSRAQRAQQLRQRRRTIGRFAEQAWVVVWGTLSFSLSVYVASQEPYWHDELALWKNWPFKQISGLSKFYYLLQTSFWLQQVFVLNVEDRRSDHWQMFSHHVVTILLLLGSYTSHFTPMGNVVLILMDPCDVVLSLAKCLRYAGQQTLCDICFGLFMVGWIISRHILYNRMLYSCFVNARRYLPEYPGQTRYDYFGFRVFAALGLVLLLCVLQAILCVWLVMIIRVAYRVVTGKGAADSRSDEESDDDDIDNEAETTIGSDVRPIESASIAAAAAASSTTSKPRALAQAENTAKRRKGKK